MRVAVVAVVVIVVVIVVAVVDVLVAFLVPTSLQKSKFIDLRNNTYRFIKKNCLQAKCTVRLIIARKMG